MMETTATNFMTALPGTRSCGQADYWRPENNLQGTAILRGNCVDGVGIPGALTMLEMDNLPADEAWPKS